MLPCPSMWLLYTPVLLRRGYIAEKKENSRELAEALFELSKAVPEPSQALLGLCAQRCAEAKDWNRAQEVVEAVLQGHVGDTTAGSTSAGVSPRECRTNDQMERVFRRFEARGDWRA